MVPATWRTGIDHSVSPVLTADGKEIDFSLNFGEGKYYPGGPKCSYNGKIVDCLTYVSESGGISGDILVEILTYFDQIRLFPHVPDGPIPVLIVDGHQSRLDPKFVEYINAEGHRWRVCLGVPYATTLWQVGDASEQNGMVKLEWYREKAKLLNWKFERNLPRAIRPEDVMPLLNKIFYKAYDNLANNKKACSVRGWFPPNRKLLDHPSLKTNESCLTNANSTTDETVESTSVTSPMPELPRPQLNVECGLAATCLDALIRDRARSEGAKKATEKRKLESDSIVENIKKSARLTSGVLTQNGVHSLNDPRFLDPFCQRLEEAAKKMDEVAAKNKARCKKKFEEVRVLRAKYGDEKTHLFKNWSMSECSSYLQYKKQKGDPGMPKELGERQQRCIEWISRPSPPSTPNQSDVEDDDSESVRDAEVAVGALLSLGAGGPVEGQDIVGEEDEYGWAPEQAEA